MKSLTKNNLLIFTLLLIFPTLLEAQDLIVTHKGDSLNCKITKIKDDNIYFTFKHKEEIRNTLLPQSQINYYQYSYYSTPEVPADKIDNHEMYPHYRVALNGGWSYRTAPIADIIPSELKSYMNGLKSGFHYSLDLSYFFTEHLGAGLKYSDYLSKGETNSASSGKLRDDIAIRYIAPYFSTRFLNSNKKNALFLNIGIGYMGYKDKGVSGDNKLTINGNTVGLSYDIGYDVSVSKDLAIGFQISMLAGTLSQYKLTNGGYTQTIKLEKDQYENLSRIDISVGLRFNK